MASSIVVSNPAILSGEPVFRGTRVPFKSLTDYLEHERSLSEFLEDFPGVTRADAIAALEEARISLVATLSANRLSMRFSFSTLSSAPRWTVTAAIELSRPFPPFMTRTFFGFHLTSL